MSRAYKIRRSIVTLTVAIVAISGFLAAPEVLPPTSSPQVDRHDPGSAEAVTVLEKLEVKGRAPKSGYSRSQFGDGWRESGGCDTRNIILNRDLADVVVNDECKVLRGVLNDPYTGKEIAFSRGADSSQMVQIDHVVALSDAWQKGAAQLDPVRREQLANDPLELLAVDGPSNQQKGASDAASWLPPNKPFRCQYVARQIAVKYKYDLWVTQAEKEAMQRVLSGCPGQALPN